MTRRTCVIGLAHLVDRRLLWSRMYVWMYVFIYTTSRKAALTRTETLKPADISAEIIHRASKCVYHVRTFPLKGRIAGPYHDKAFTCAID